MNKNRLAGLALAALVVLGLGGVRLLLLAGTVDEPGSAGADPSQIAPPAATRGPGPAARPGSNPSAAGGPPRPPRAAPGPPPGRAVGDDEPVDELEIPDHVTVWPASAEGIVGAVREVLPDIRDCYEDALAEYPDLSGKLQVQLSLMGAGGVGKIAGVGITAGDLVDAPMEDCVLDVFSVLQFDPPSDGVLTVTYPIVFESE